MCSTFDLRDSVKCQGLAWISEEKSQRGCRDPTKIPPGHLPQMRLHICVCVLESKCRCVSLSWCTLWVWNRGLSVYKRGWKARIAFYILFTLLLPWHVSLLHMSLCMKTIYYNYFLNTLLITQSAILHLINCLLLKLLSAGLFNQNVLATEHRVIQPFQIWLSKLTRGCNSSKWQNTAFWATGEKGNNSANRGWTFLKWTRVAWENCMKKNNDQDI